MSVPRTPFNDRRSRTWQSLVVCCCIGLAAYFAYHLKNGRHGLEARETLIERLALLDFEIKSLEAGVDRLKRDIALLRPDQPDPDIIDEVARDTLGYVYPNERVLLAPELR